MRFIELFAGIGGFRYGLERCNSNKCADEEPGQTKLDEEMPMRKRKALQEMPRGRRGIGDTDKEERSVLSADTGGVRSIYNCVWSNEIDKYACEIYRKNYGKEELYEGDITKVKTDDIPEHDLLTGGFPCQAFSIAGKRRGFNDTRGTLFFEIARICRAKKPRYILLENVKGLLSHESGRTFQTILKVLTDIGYVLQWEVLNSKNFGVPQNRERVFIVGQRKDIDKIQIFPIIDYREDYYEITKTERVYELSQEVSEVIKVFFQSIPQGEGQELSKQQMQILLTEVEQGISQGKCREIPRDTEAMDTESKRSLQVIEELNSWASCQDKSREVYGVVQIPTEEVLLLWNRAEATSISYRCLQQQDISFDCGQDRLIKGLSRGEFGSLLFAVQPYQGELFYSIGNGRDWRKIYQAKVEEKCNPILSSILEENVDQKYFLSEKQTNKILQQIQKGQASIHKL